MYLYHVTFYKALPSIEEHGLRPGGRGIGGAVYDTHRRGAIFLTEGDGVFFWAERAEQWAEYNSEDLFESELVPVLLRMRRADIITRCEDDEIGSRDARSDAFRCRATVSPEDLQVWAGVDGVGSWVPLSEWDRIPFAEAFDTEDGEDEDDEVHYLRSGGGGSVLVPPVDNGRRSRQVRRKAPRGRRALQPKRRK